MSKVMIIISKEICLLLLSLSSLILAVNCNGDGGGDGSDADTVIDGETDVDGVDGVDGTDGTDGTDGIEGDIAETVSCEPGTVRCDDAAENLVVCNEDGTGWRLEESCAVSCDPGAKRCVNCQPAGYSKCDTDGSLKECDGYDWIEEMACRFGCQTVPETGEIQCLPSNIGDIEFPPEAIGDIGDDAFAGWDGDPNAYKWLIFNTDTGEIRKCTEGIDAHHVGDGCTIFREEIVGADAETGIYFNGTFMFRSLDISGGKILSCRGSAPLKLFISSDAQIGGLVYAGALYDEYGNLIPGCGGNQANEGAGRGGRGSGNKGGGGGAYGGGGGTGSGSGDTPVSGGFSYGSEPLMPLMGGSGGGSADFPGGLSGGAVEIISMGYINISGKVYAGGGPGSKGEKRSHSSDHIGTAGGGGSGGAVLIEGKRVDISGVISCGGGSGGGGVYINDYTRGGSGGDGQFAPVTDYGQAEGGAAGPSGCRGGNGSGFMGDRESIVGEPVPCSEDGGGGGGGGCGRIRINSENTVMGDKFHPSIESGLTTMNNEIHFKSE